MTFILGLTGSIGMGKTTVAAMLREAGAMVSDADAEVRRLLAEDGDTIAEIGAAFPGTVKDGVVDREALGWATFPDDAAMKRLEAILHPRVREAHRRAAAQALAEGRRLLVLEVPLLFETGGDAACDAVAVVTAPGFVQRRRVLARPRMKPEKLALILKRQMPDEEKRRRADFVIHTGWGRALTRWQLRRMLGDIKKRHCEERSDAAI